MSRDDIIRMAREAGIVTGENLRFPEGYRYRSHGTPTNVREQALIDFAALVAAAERERIAAEFDRRNTGTGFYEPQEPAEIVRARGQT